MIRIEYIPESSFQAAMLRCEDELGNRGNVTFPRLRKSWGSSEGGDWEDAEVRMNNRAEGGADETIAAADFSANLGRMAKVLDLAFAHEAVEHKERAAREAREDEIERKAWSVARQRRCEEVSQYYMQLVRVQREGMSSNAKGELRITVHNEDTDDQSISSLMYLREGNGNMWDFQAHSIGKFEYKDGNRYTEVHFTPMEELEAAAKKEIEAEEAAAV